MRPRRSATLAGPGGLGGWAGRLGGWARQPASVTAAPPVPGRTTWSPRAALGARKKITRVVSALGPASGATTVTTPNDTMRVPRPRRSGRRIISRRAPGAWLRHPCINNRAAGARRPVTAVRRERNSTRGRPGQAPPALSRPDQQRIRCLAAVHRDDGPRAQVDPVTFVQGDPFPDGELAAVDEGAVGRSGVADEPGAVRC